MTANIKICMYLGGHTFLVACGLQITSPVSSMPTDLTSRRDIHQKTHENGDFITNNMFCFVLCGFEPCEQFCPEGLREVRRVINRRHAMPTFYARTSPSQCAMLSDQAHQQARLQILIKNCKP